MTPGAARLLSLAVLLAAPACAASPDPAPATAAADPSPSAVAGSGRDDRPVLDLSAVPPAPPPAPEARGLVSAGEDPALAVVDGIEVRASEVTRFLFRYDPARGLDALNQILDARILDADAAALGVGLPPGEVEARTFQQVRDRETEVRVQYGTETTLEEYLADRFGITLEGYRRDLAALVRLQALRDRLVRYEALREERVRIRFLVLRDEETARDAARRLREGADFAALARQVSQAPADELPSYRRDEIQPPALAEEIFALGPGEVSRPVRVARDGKEVFQVFKLVEHTRARNLSWGEASPEVERGLKKGPVAPAEYLQWARRARERHGVKVLLVEPAAPEKR